MMHRLTLFVLSFALLVSACDPNDFEGPDEVSKLRTLAIGMEPAELGPVSFGARWTSPTPASDAVASVKLPRSRTRARRMAKVLA